MSGECAACGVDIDLDVEILGALLCLYRADLQDTYVKLHDGETQVVELRRL